MRWLLIANPENRRASLFQAALARRGHAPAEVIPWIELLRDPERLARESDAPAWLRVDSFGEDFEVERELLRLGFDDARRDPRLATIAPAEIDRLAPSRGRILCPRQAHLGFLRALRTIEETLARRPAWTPLAQPASIAELVDKRATSRRYEALGVPVPRRIEAGATPESLRGAMEAAGAREVFVKLSCGSSASCLAIYDGRALTTTMEVASDGWFNSLRVRRYREPARVDELLRFLLAEGSQVEESVPKPRLGREYVDCRVLVIAGVPAFVVVRRNKLPITNLHLGGGRGDVEELRAACGDAAWEAAMKSCAVAAGAHRCLHVGVDLLFERGWRGHRVLEGNAFGDLLPNLTRDGLDVWEWQIRVVEEWAARAAGSTAKA